jgi:hypothetical protein
MRDTGYAEPPTDLYRRGSASSPRLDQVRTAKDIHTFEQDGILWVTARSGGVSTFSTLGIGKNWWKLPQGAPYPHTLYVVNDHGNHYNWEPNTDMPFSAYVALLAALNPHFIKVN